MFREANILPGKRDDLAHETQEHKKTRSTIISLNIFDYRGKASSAIKHHHLPTTPKKRNK